MGISSSFAPLILLLFLYLQPGRLRQLLAAVPDPCTLGRFGEHRRQVEKCSLSCKHQHSDEVSGFGLTDATSVRSQMLRHSGTCANIFELRPSKILGASGWPKWISIDLHAKPSCRGSVHNVVNDILSLPQGQADQRSSSRTGCWNKTKQTHANPLWHSISYPSLCISPWRAASRSRQSINSLEPIISMKHLHLGIWLLLPIFTILGSSLPKQKCRQEHLAKTTAAANDTLAISLQSSSPICLQATEASIRHLTAVRAMAAVPFFGWISSLFWSRILNWQWLPKAPWPRKCQPHLHHELLRFAEAASSCHRSCEPHSQNLPRVTSTVAKFLKFGWHKSDKMQAPTRRPSWWKCSQGSPWTNAFQVALETEIVAQNRCAHRAAFAWTTFSAWM